MSRVSVIGKSLKRLIYRAVMVRVREEEGGGASEYEIPLLGSF